MMKQVSKFLISVLTISILLCGFSGCRTLAVQPDGSVRSCNTNADCSTGTCVHDTEGGWCRNL